MASIPKEYINFVTGDVYHCVYFTDDKMIYPFVGSFVHLGVDILGDEDRKTWYFQDCESFAELGSFLNGTKGDRQILSLTGPAVQHMVGIEGLLDELTRARSRRIGETSSDV